MLGLHQGALEKIRMEGMGHFRGFGRGLEAQTARKPTKIINIGCAGLWGHQLA